MAVLVALDWGWDAFKPVAKLGFNLVIAAGRNYASDYLQNVGPRLRHLGTSSLITDTQA